jgi:hypothetical protein
MTISTIPWNEGLAFALCALIAVACYELLFVWPVRRRLAALGGELMALDSAVCGTRGLKGRMLEAERRTQAQLTQLTERLGQLELRTDTHSYEQAISLASKGGGTDRLITYFGLSEGEANLVRLMHGRPERKPDSKRRV